MKKNNFDIIYFTNVDWFFYSHRMPIAKKMIESGYRVALITMDTGLFEEIEKNGIICFNVDMGRKLLNPVREIRLLFDIYKILLQNNSKIIQAVTFKPSIYLAFIDFFFIKKKSIIITVTGLSYFFKYGKIGWPFTTIFKILFNKKNIYFLFQNNDDYTIYKQLGLIFSNNQIIIKGVGIDHNRFTPVKKEKEKKLVILFTGRMLKDKGVIELLKASKNLYEKFKYDIKFILVGGKDLANPNFLDDHDISPFIVSDYVEWVGFSNDVLKYYNMADIMVFPSYREGLPKSLLEAMSVGLPIITTNSPGCKECVENNVNGFLVPIKDVNSLVNKIKYLIENPKSRIDMGNESRKKLVSQFSFDIIYKEHLSFYKLINNEF